MTIHFYKTGEFIGRSYVFRYNIPKKDRHSDSSTDWTLLYLNINVEKDGFELNYEQIDTAHADMCFSNITITHSVY